MLEWRPFPAVTINVGVLSALFSSKNQNEALYETLQRKQFLPCLLNLCVKARSQVSLLIYALLELSGFYPPWIDEEVSNLGSLL